MKETTIGLSRGDITVVFGRKVVTALVSNNSCFFAKAKESTLGLPVGGIAGVAIASAVTIVLVTEIILFLLLAKAPSLGQSDAGFD